MVSREPCDLQNIQLTPEFNLSLMEFGSPEGSPVLYFHGWPSSSVEARPLHHAAERAGIRIIALNRPGYGLTTSIRLHNFSEWAKWVERYVDQRGWEEFHLIAMSGGTPYALACAQVLSSRVQSVHVASGLGPAETRAVRQSLTPGIRGLLSIGRALPMLGRIGLSIAGRVVQFFPGLPGRMVQYDPQLTSSDRAVLKWNANQDLMNQIAAQAFQTGSFGAFQDGYFYSRPWDFSLGSVSAPCRFWHGEDDKITSVFMIQKMIEHLPDAQLRIFPGEGHFSTPWARAQQFIDSVKSLMLHKSR